MVKILQREAEELRKVAEEVPLQDINTPKIKKVIEDMKQALEGEDDGVAIAAPQIGKSLRIFVVSHRAFELINEEKSHSAKAMRDKESKESKKEESVKFEDQVFINPKILKVSKEKQMMDEGCLSVRYLYGKVLRSKKATVEAIDEHGKKFTMGGSGLIAQIFQHETDHLDGVLFIDEAVDLEEIPPHSAKASRGKPEKLDIE